MTPVSSTRDHVRVLETKQPFTNGVVFDLFDLLTVLQQSNGLLQVFEEELRIVRGVGGVRTNSY